VAQEDGEGMADLVDKQIDALRRIAALPAMQAEGFMDVAVPAMQGLLNRLASQAAEVSRLRAIVEAADNMLPWLRQGTIWVSGRIRELDQKPLAHMFPQTPEQEEKSRDTWQNWVCEANRLAAEYARARAALATGQQERRSAPDAGKGVGRE
jgi:hypothetical protein